MTTTKRAYICKRYHDEVKRDTERHVILHGWWETLGIMYGDGVKEARKRAEAKWGTVDSVYPLMGGAHPIKTGKR